MPKIVFIDVDGTLVTYENQLPGSAVEAIRLARANGHRVYLTTGRSRAEMPQELWDIGIDGMIGGNGSYVEHDGQVVMHQTLSLEETTSVVDWLLGRGLEFYLEANDGLFASPRFCEVSPAVIGKYMAGKGMDIPTNLKASDVLHGLVEGEDLYRHDVNKISFILSSYQDHLDSKDAFPTLKAGTWGGRGEEALFGDLGVAGIDKAHAVDVLVAHLGADLADTIAMGDAAIDISMIEHCAVGVAMGNASQPVKDAANYVTTDVEDDGLHKAFEHLGLLQ